MGFLISAFQEKRIGGDFNEALRIHQAWQKKERSIVIEEKHCRITCFAEGCASESWSLTTAEGTLSSFIYIMGWCYRIDSVCEKLDESQYKEMLSRHKQGLSPVGEDYSGNYAVVVYDAASGRIAIQPDRWALMSVYFAVSDAGIAVSNRSVAVASLVGASINGYSLTSMLRGTHVPFGCSLFAGVHRVTCGCFLDVEAQRARVTRRRAFSLYVPTEESSLDESVENVTENVCRVAARLMGCKSTIFDLTGGHDSRLTASAISSRANSDLISSTLAWRVAGPENHPDVQIARQIANMCQWRLLRLKSYSPAEASLEELQKVTVLSDGTSLVNSAYSRARQEVSYPNEWDWLVGSQGGELFRGFLWKQEMWKLGRTSQVDLSALLAYRLYASRAIDFSLYLKDGPSLEEHEEVLLGPYREISELGGDLLNPYKLDVMYLHKLSHGACLTLSWLTGLRNIRLPLLSWEVTQASLSTSWRHRVNRGLQLRTIARLNPALSKLPSDSGEPMRPFSPSSAPSYLRAKLVLGGQQFCRVVRRYTGNRVNNGPTSCDPLPPSLLSRVSQAKCIGAIFHPSLIRRLETEVTSPSPSRDWVRTFYTILTLELLLQEIPALRKQVEFPSVPTIES